MLHLFWSYHFREVSLSVGGEGAPARARKTGRAVGEVGFQWRACRCHGGHELRTSKGKSLGTARRSYRGRTRYGGAAAAAMSQTARARASGGQLGPFSPCLWEMASPEIKGSFNGGAETGRRQQSGERETVAAAEGWLKRGVWAAFERVHSRGSDGCVGCPWASLAHPTQPVRD
jgi:hypothetical protein